LNSRGISTAVHYPIADHRQPFWSGALASLHLPVTEDAVERILTVPCFPEMTEEEVELVCDGLRSLS
jgi:dTDP-3-amino-2,3,6-trideoxy-4-keto-D-glucose/dTDP-3-amino-3,4,6-trideoxy-alpha-D-glucose/dTDP-2,6-dideoxy-D-kanosamine transaminase